jgi:hypothetical protein
MPPVISRAVAAVGKLAVIDTLALAQRLRDKAGLPSMLGDYRKYLAAVPLEAA